jgi:hypothetical protein
MKAKGVGGRTESAWRPLRTSVISPTGTRCTLPCHRILSRFHTSSRPCRNSLICRDQGTSEPPPRVDQR